MESIILLQRDGMLRDCKIDSNKEIERNTGEKSRHIQRKWNITEILLWPPAEQEYQHCIKKMKI